MEALLEWLKAGVPAGQLWIYIMASLIALSIFNLVVSNIARVLGIRLGRGERVPINKRLFLIDFPIGALMEEFVFRFPLVLVIWLAGPSSWVIWAAIALSIIFGWLHGNFYCVFAQGIGGFIFSLIFLKCGGFQGMVWQALLVATLIHLLVNWISVALEFLSGKKDIEI